MYDVQLTKETMGAFLDLVEEYANDLVKSYERNELAGKVSDIVDLAIEDIDSSLGGIECYDIDDTELNYQRWSMFRQMMIVKCSIYSDDKIPKHVRPLATVLKNFKNTIKCECDYTIPY